MAKGKKQKAQKKADAGPSQEVPSIASLTLSEEQPSTSSETAAPTEATPPVTSTPAEEEDEGGLGLGPGKTRKKKPRKKKEATPETTPETPQASGDRPPSGPAPVVVSAAVPTPTWGARESQPPGFPQPSFPQGVPPGFQQPITGLQFVPQATPLPVVSAQAYGEPVLRGPGPQQAIPVVSAQAYGEPVLKGPGPQQPIPVVSAQAYGEPVLRGPGPQQPTGLWPRPQTGPGPQQQRGPAPPRQRGPAPQRLRGPAPQQQRGPAPQQQSSPWPTPSAWAPQQSGPAPQVGPAQQPPPPQLPQQVPQKVPQQSVAPQRGPSQPQASSSRGDVRKTPSEGVMCRYKIPEKIIGNSVSAMQIRVLTNYLPMTIKLLKIHRYDVSFKPDKPKKMIPKAYNAAKNKLFPRVIIAFDQMKNCYTLNPLPKVTQEDRLATTVEITDNNGKAMTFEVSFKGTGTVDLNTINTYMTKGGTSLSPPTEAIQCVDVILRQGTLENYIKAGRQFFKRPANPINLGDGLEMWTGLFQSAIFTSRAFVNIDVAHKGFPRQQPLIDAMARDFKLDLTQPLERQRNRFAVENFRMFIKNLRVVAAIGGDSTARGQKREFICNDVIDPPGQISFVLKDPNGKQLKMTVADYFTRVKNIRLRYPNLNCMWVGPRDKSIYYPIELLEVSYGQALNKQLNEIQLQTMVREAATPPDARKRKIEEVIQDMQYSQNPHFKHFGLEIENKFHEVRAKVLTPPILDIGGQRTITPAKGAWQAKRLLKPEALESWAIISIEADLYQNNGDTIITLMQSCGRDLGMRVNEPKERFNNIQIRDLKEVLFRALRMEIRFLIIIVPTRGRDYYQRVKQMAERDVGILTQCIKEYTALRRMNTQTARNILLKVNSKLMGINQALDRRSMPACLAKGGVMVVGADVTHPSPDQVTINQALYRRSMPPCLANGGVMVVGADVTHPSPDQSAVPSIAAVTASIDPQCFIYNIGLSIQTPKKEMIVDFEDMMVEHLQVYKARQGSLPRKIFVFRDGVSEGQFAQVMNSELQAIHKAYQRMTGNQEKPEVLFLLVQKRHHTRLFNKTVPQQNVEPGTVVDEEIVHARELDFYLVSHQAIKGTARPTRYHAVCNDGKIPHDEVEQLTYYLCHLYSRCMRAVSYPTPTYYAHLACLRARSLTHGQKFDNADLERNPKRLRVLDQMLEFSRMFFV